jgi:hypothetical protein
MAVTASRETPYFVIRTYTKWWCGWREHRAVDLPECAPGAEMVEWLRGDKAGFEDGMMAK